MTLPAFPELPSSPEAKLRWIAWGEQCRKMERELAAAKWEHRHGFDKYGVAGFIRSQGE
jgi:hypothetical protein